MTIIMLIMMFTLLLLFASQGSLALAPEGMWHNDNNNNNIVIVGCHGNAKNIKGKDWGIYRIYPS